MAKISVLGAGSWGTALALASSYAGHEVLLWTHNQAHAQMMQGAHVNARYLPEVKFPQNLQVSAQLSQLLSHATTILVAVPSHAFKSVITAIVPYWTEKHTLVWATKGLDDSGNLLHQVVDQTLGMGVKKAVLSGPSFATELAQALPTAVAVASDDIAYAAYLAELFSYQHFRVYTTSDLIGAQLGGAVKNVLAIACGISDGLGYGANARAALITRGLAEMMRLGQALSAAPETFMGLTGLGDLVLTCTDNKSRNRRYGLALGQGASAEAAQTEIGQVVEGILTAGHVYQLANTHQVEMPIVEQVYRVLQNQCTVQEAVSNLLGRTLKSE
ncbi:MAG: glycerol-3-phosphate dehydrogenase [Legionellales bacterium]|nr:glycerol-3-phosphate dehydrogenase [Legionellales bacterium]